MSNLRSRVSRLEHQSHVGPGRCPGCGRRPDAVVFVLVTCPDLDLTERPNVPIEGPVCSTCGRPRMTQWLKAVQKEAVP
jgi:hypothetical protein